MSVTKQAFRNLDENYIVGVVEGGECMLSRRNVPLMTHYPLFSPIPLRTQI